MHYRRHLMEYFNIEKEEKQSQTPEDRKEKN
jgi:hypothetical protein